MTVYVDDLLPTKKTTRWPHTYSCHMTADSYDELLAFAVQLGLSPSWIQAQGHRYEHFDLNANKRHEAVRMGAVEETRRASVRRMRKRISDATERTQWGAEMESTEQRDTCDAVGVTVNDTCPDCGASLSFNSEDLTVLECDNGCGWQCVDDPDANGQF